MLMTQANAAQPAPPAPDLNPVVRASEGYFLRLVKLFTELTGGDIVKGVLLVTIIYANTEDMRRADDDPPPSDGMRRPVSVYALSKSLGTPYETTRRYVKQMVAKGLCERAGPRGGVIVPTHVLSSARVRAISTRHYSQLMAFIDQVIQLSGR